ncbi:MAG: hypothetical protein C0603_06745 [Denitrovibrio sp.]|nr:MAG: hypothetical protein C0603_06745 [Denitrovibrio sp.]
MQSLELYQLTQWVDKELVKTELLQKYTNLINVLNANVQRRNNHAIQPFEQQKKALLECVKGINMNMLSGSQLKSLNMAGMYENVGEKGFSKLIKIFSNIIDIAQVVAEISKMNSITVQWIQQNNALALAMKPFLNKTEYDYPEGHYLARVIFDNDAYVNSFEDLLGWSDEWRHITRGISIAINEQPDEVKLVGGGKGSFIVELTATGVFILTLGNIVKVTLDCMLKYRQLEMKTLELKKMKEDFLIFKDDFEEDATRLEDRKEKYRDHMKDIIFKGAKERIKGFNKKAEAEFRKAVSSLVDFMTKGGDVDCVIDDSTEEGDDILGTKEALKVDFAEIRALKECLSIEGECEPLKEEDE